MASLNTLRTKFGVVLSVIIAFALLAFVLSLKTEMGFSGNDPKVGVIDGAKIKYSEYLEEYDRVKSQNNASENDPEQADMLAQGAWQSLLNKHVLEPGLEMMGVTVGESERMGMISGEYPSQVLYSAFADPRTGVYDVSAVTEFLAQAETNVQAQQAWNNLNEQVLLDRGVNKFIGLIKGGTYVNSLEVAQGVKAANNSYTGKWAGRKYESVPDSLVEVSSSELREYYNKHKDQFKQQPSRTISYVLFDVSATDSDMLILENTVKGVGDEFAAATAADLRSFVRANRNGEIMEHFVTAAQLPEDEAEALMAGRMYGPVLKNNAWTMARVLDEKIVFDTLGIRHIILPYTQEKLADSLLTVLRAGGDFAQTAQQYSVYAATAASGGEVGKMPFSAFTGDFATALAGARQNDIVKIASGDAIQLLQVYYTGKPTKQVQVASISYPVEASAETRRTIHSAAGTFQVKAQGSVQNFTDAASDAVVTPRVATIVPGERDLSGLEDSRDIVRWAYGAEEEDVSEIFNVGGDYAIAILTEIDNEKYTPQKRANDQIRKKILRDKKYDYIVKNASGSTFDSLTASLEAKESGAFTDVNYSLFYVYGIGVEPRLVGAIAATDKAGVVSAPVKGTSGVYVFEVDNIATEEKQTVDAEKVRAQARMEGVMQQRSLQAIQQMAKIEDMRGKYF